MATTNNVSLVFFLLSALFPQLHCRESQFFSKFSNNKPNENERIRPTAIQPLQQPDFILQTEDSAGYGLYGKLPPSTTVNNLPTTFPENYNTVTYTTPASSTDSYETTDPQYDGKNQDNGDSNMYNNQKQENLHGHFPPLTTSHVDDNNLPENYNPVAYTTPIHSKDSELYNNERSKYNNQFMYNSGKQVKGEYESNMYNTKNQGVSDSRVLDNGKYYHEGNVYNSNKQGMGETRFMDNWDGEMYNTEKQGMSDTRFMENGKYNYDLNSGSVNVNGAGEKNGYYGDNVNAYKNRRYYVDNVNLDNKYNFNAGFQENQDEVFTP